MKLVKDKDSGTLRLPHRIDESTGMYRGKVIAPKKVKKVKESTKADKMGPAEGHVHVEKEEKEKVKKPGLVGRMVQDRAKSRSGFGGGA